MPTVTVPDVWDLDADFAWLSTAQGRLHAAASTLDSRWAGLSRGITRLDGSWTGARAESYLEHAGTLRSAFVTAVAHATTMSEATRDLAEALEAAQASLDASFARAKEGSSSAYRSGGTAYFTYPDPEDDEEAVEPPAIRREECAAQEVQGTAREAVQSFATTFTAAGDELATLASSWHGPAHGQPGWDVPEGGVTGVTVTQVGNDVVVNSGDSGDIVDISIDPATGETLVVINGEEFRYPPGRTVTINTGGGNDSITIAGDVPNRIRIVAGDGDDTMTADESGNHLEVFANDGNDTVTTGSGWDYVSGGTGHDYIDTGDGDDLVSGGAGKDVLYGMGGDDVLIGGSGQDYLEGARGDDVVLGMDGNDIVSGGRGNDVAVGGAGDDVLYSGLGNDTLDGGTGTDEGFHTRGDTVSAEGGEEVVIDDRPWDETFNIGGDDRFQARVEADLDMFASSPTGQALIDEIRGHVDDSGDRVTIRPTTQGNSASTGGVVNYNPYSLNVEADPEEPWYEEGRPPAVGFYHELGHINQYNQPGGSDRWNGDGGDRLKYDENQPLIERQNVGLTWDHDGDPNTPDIIDPDYDFRWTENALRAEWGLPTREKY